MAHRGPTTALLLTAAVGLHGCDMVASSSPWASDEGEVSGQGDGLDYRGGANQFAGGFEPANAPFGGFGGGDCVPSRVPVVFVHGNGDEARNWDYPASTGGPSAYDSLRAAGYEPCELFGITWLSDDERALPQLNYHRPAKADRVAAFIEDVLAYTGSEQVDLVGHSMGVTVSMHALERGDLWSSVRRLVSISGGLRGLTVCDASGYANPAFPICGSQNAYDDDVFGFYRHAWYAPNPRMGRRGYRDEPGRREDVSFYSLRAGIHDQILCATAGFVAGCERSALFADHANVRAQLDVGHGSTAADLDFDLSDWTIFNVGGGDIDGVGHFRTRNNTGAILANMLMTSCTGEDCCAGYDGVCAP